MTLSEKMRTFLASVPGWKTRRKLVVLESDDWGSIRMSSNAARKRLIDKGINLKGCPYSKYDVIESADDIRNLSEALLEISDIHNNPAVLTANFIMANPDFKRIKESGYENYYYERFTDTYLNKTGEETLIELKTAIQANSFYPQLHGREHLNVKRWMRQLLNNDSPARKAFQEGVFGLGYHTTFNKNENFMRALDLDNPEDFDYQDQALKDASRIFKDIFGYSSKSFIAPGYVWSDEHEKTLSKLGVRYFQGKRKQVIPVPNSTIYNTKIRVTGNKNDLGQMYLVRNVFFEPSIYPNINWEDYVMNRVSIAFSLKNPVIIGTHRLNYIGGLSHDNREKNIKLLMVILKTIQSKWPDVEFITSDQLGDLIYS